MDISFVLSMVLLKDVVNQCSEVEEDHLDLLDYWQLNIELILHLSNAS
jgi:hypothetical protein